MREIDSHIPEKVQRSLSRIYLDAESNISHMGADPEESLISMLLDIRNNSGSSLLANVRDKQTRDQIAINSINQAIDFWTEKLKKSRDKGFSAFGRSRITQLTDQIDEITSGLS